MKKSDIGLIIGVVVVLVISAFVSVGKPFEKVTLTSLDFLVDNDNEDFKEYDDSEKKEYDDFIIIDYEEYNKLLESDNYFFIAIGRTGCSFCEKYKPVLEEVASDLDIPLHYIDIADLDNEEIKDFSISNSYLESNEWGTPTTLILNNDKVIASQQGYVDADKLKDFIINYVKLDGEE